MMIQVVSGVISSGVIVGLFSLLLKTKFETIDERFEDMNEKFSHYEQKTDAFYKDMHRLETKIEIMITEQKYLLERLAQVSKDLISFVDKVHNAPK